MGQRTAGPRLATVDAPGGAAAARPAPASASSTTTTASYTEAEQTTFAASGTVRTADGREIAFDLQLSMSRLYHEESSVSLRAGDAVRATDPLVLNFAGTAAQLTDQRFAFDLDADGSADQINFAGPGRGFLDFFDPRNKYGKVDNGRELFGPTSGRRLPGTGRAGRTVRKRLGSTRTTPPTGSCRCGAADAAGKEGRQSLAEAASSARSRWPGSRTRSRV
jgi:hypothetical protein